MARSGKRIPLGLGSRRCLGRSAEWHSAVSRTGSPQRRDGSRTPQPVHALPNAIRRHSRLTICATPEAAGVAAVGGGLAVADVIEAILELLPGDGGAVGPEAFAGGYLAEGVVLINPVGTVGVGGAGALVGGVHSFRGFTASVSRVRADSFMQCVNFKKCPIYFTRGISSCDLIIFESRACSRLSKPSQWRLKQPPSSRSHLSPRRLSFMRSINNAASEPAMMVQFARSPALRAFEKASSSSLTRR